jgi:hypothetical protein
MKTRQYAVRAAALATLAGLPAAVMGQQVFTTYTGPSGGSWMSAFNWNHGVPDVPGDVPLIPGGSYVVLSGNVTVDKIGISPGGTIGVGNGSMLGIRTQIDTVGTTGIFGGGILGLASVGNGTYLRLVGPAGSNAIHGASGNPSVIELSNTTANVIDGSAVGIIFHNEGTIEGAGQVGADVLVLHNTGTIKAIYQNPLIVDPAGTMTNEGAMIAQAGYLRLQGGTFTNTGTGEIDLTGDSTALVDLSGCTVVGGHLNSVTVPSGIFRALSSAQLDGVTLAAPLHIPNGHLMYLTNSLDTAGGGHLYMDSVGNGTYMRLTNDVHLTGNGTIEISNTTANIIDGNAVGLTLTNDMPNGIVGSGQLGADVLRIVNNTNIYASGSSPMYIDPAGGASGGCVNNGHLWALTGGTLVLSGGFFDNTAGFIDVQPNATCTITSSTVSGGTLQSSQPNGFFSVQSSSLLTNVTLTGSTIAGIPNGHLVYAQGSITNNGTFNMNSVGNGTYLRCYGGDVVLAGSGVYTCSNTTANVMDANVGGQRLTLQNATIRGSLQLGAGTLVMTNNGLIESQGSSGLYISPAGGSPGFDNNSTLRALTGSFLLLSGSSFDNADGLIDVQAGAYCTLSGTQFTGGTLRTTGSGVIYGQSNSVLRDITVDGALAIPNGHLNYLVGTITTTGAGTVTMSSVGNGTYLRTNGDAILAGPGVFACSNTTANIFDANVSGQHLTNNSTLRGSFQLGGGTLALVNNGLIEAAGSSGAYIQPMASPAFDNNATARSTTGSFLVISGGAVDDSGGSIEAQDGSSTTLSATSLFGGTLRTFGTGVIYAQSNSVIRDFALEGVLAVPNGNLVYAQGTINNSGTLRMASVGNGTYVRTLGDLTLAGTGDFAFSDTLANIVDANVAGQTLTNYNAMHGSVQLGSNALDIVNRGSITADASNPIYIDPAAGGLLNDTTGTLHVQGPGAMLVYDGPFTNAGQIIVDATRLLRRATAGNIVQTGGASTVNGEIRCDNGSLQLQGGQLRGTGLVTASVSNTGGTVAPGASPGNLTIQGAYAQGAQGTMEIELAGPAQGSQFDHLAVAGAASLGGTLNVRFLNGYAPAVGSTFRFLDCTGTRGGTFGAVTVADAAPNLGAAVQYDTHGAWVVIVQVCGSPDFDCDGDIGTDADIEAFFTCLAGNCPGAPCNNSADFNGDGDIGTDADIESFFRVLAGGAC